MQNQPATFRTAEQKDETKPAYIYIFKHTPFFGAPTSYYLTNYDGDLTVNGLPVSKGSDPQAFLSCQIAHSEIEQQTEQNAPGTSIVVGLNGSAEANDLKTYFLTPNPARIDVTIARVNTSALPAVTWGTDTYTVFRGVKNLISLEGQNLTLNCINLMLQEDGMIPRYYYQKTCQHDLGSVGPGLCNAVVDQAKFRVTGNLSAVNRVNRTVDLATNLFDDASSASPDKFIGGKLFVLSGGNPVNVITVAAAQLFVTDPTAVAGCASTGNVNLAFGLSGTPSSPISIDGFAVYDTSNSIGGTGHAPTVVLLKNQTNPIQNGLYSLVLVSIGRFGGGNYQFQRTSDLLAGAVVSVTSGTINHGTTWTQTTPTPIAGTDNIVFVSGAATHLRFRLSWWDSSLTVSTPVKILRGCLHIVASCQEFANVPNFGGTPYVSITNLSVDGINT